MHMAVERTRQIPAWLRWCAVIFLAAWFTTYWIYWRPTTFLHLCDVAVILTCMGLWTSNSLLLSSQAVSSLAVDLVWCFDVGYTALLAKHPIGGTEYMWDVTRPLWVRMFSLFHVIWPVLLLWAIYRLGYDRRGWILQSGIAAILMVASRFLKPEDNFNYAFTDPFFHRAWGSAPVHVALTLGVLIGAVYLPTHLILTKCFPARDGASHDE